MQTWILVMGLAVMILVLGVFAIMKTQKQAEIRKEHPGYLEGHWMGQGVGMGMAIGTGIGVALGNIGMGMAIGVAIGAAIGAGLEKQHADEIRPPTEEEKALTRRSRLIALTALALGGVVFIVIYFLSR